MSQPDAAPAGPAPTIGRADASRVAVATAVAAASSMLVVAGAPRLLGSVADTTLFLTFWSALFAFFGVLSGVSIETTRAVTAAAGAAAPPGPRVGLVGAAVGVGLGAAVAALAPIWGPLVFSRDATALALLVALGVTGYAVHQVVVGALAGARRWGTYSGLIAADSAVRLGLVAAVALTTGSLVGAAGGAAAAAFTWLALLAVSRPARVAATVRADVALVPYLRRLGAASVATGASAVLVVGFPTLLALTTADTEYRAAAPLLLAITLTRAPLMIPLNAYQGVAVTHFVQHRDRGLRAMLPIGRVVLGVGVLGAVAAWLVGPWLLELVGDGPEYHLSGLVLGGLTLGATGLALVTLTGAVCQALTLHGAFVGGWLAAVAVALGLLLLPLPLADRAVLALVAGPVVGIGVHLTALRRAAPAGPGGRAGHAAPLEEAP